MEEITRSKISNEELRELEAEVLEVPLVVLSHRTSVHEFVAQCSALGDGVSWGSRIDNQLRHDE